MTTYDLGKDATSRQVWFPGVEMGFTFTPSMNFDDYYLEFPIHIQTIPPFLDKYAAMGDAGIAAYFRTYRNWGAGLVSDISGQSIILQM